MHAEVISIGDELTSGQRLDTNSQWLSERLTELGIHVLYHTTVGDELEVSVRVFREAISRADVVISSGGLGPTADDLTRDALAAVTGTQLVLDEQALAHIRGLFARRKRPMPERNTVQAMFPAGSRVIPNPHGTAPGIGLVVPRADGGECRVYALPGVPAEMRQMWQESLAGELAGLAAGRVIRHRRIKCFGVGESDLEAMLPDLIRRGRTPLVGITVSDATITLRITAAGATPEECSAAMAPTVATIREALGTLVFGEEEDELEHAVVRLLAAHRKTLAIAEWGTAGLVVKWLGEAIADCGLRIAHWEGFVGGVVICNAEAATRLLDIPGELLVRRGPASAQLATAMAAACQAKFGADLALAVSDFPEVESVVTEPKHVYFALATAGGTRAYSAPFAGHPALLKVRAAKQALNFVRLAL